MKKLLLLVAAVMLVVPASASALTWSQAWNKTWLRTIWLCQNRGSGFYNCQHANWPTAPTCKYSGITKPATVQWICDGEFTQTPIYTGPLQQRICSTVDWWSPGGVLLWESVRCAPYGGIG